MANRYKGTVTGQTLAVSLFSAQSPIPEDISGSWPFICHKARLPVRWAGEQSFTRYTLDTSVSGVALVTSLMASFLLTVSPSPTAVRYPLL